jgi:hypothetical protein
MGKDWADVLEGLPRDAIQRACLRYMREEPSRRPTPGAIYALARAEMPRPQIVRSTPMPEASQAPRVTAERAAQIMAEAGFRPRKFGGASDDQ